VWQDIAVRGTINLGAGPPSGGKTTLLFLILGARLNLGEPVELLGRMVTPAPEGTWIVLIEGEHGETSTCRKIERSCEILRVDDVALQRLIIVARKAVHIGSPEWEDVRRMVAAGLVSDIALDTIARVAPAESNDEAAQVAIFDLVAQTIESAPTEETKPTVWACGHTRKNNKSGGPEDVLGSTQRAGQSDTVFLVEGNKHEGRTQSSLVTFVKLREEPDVYPLPVEYALAWDGDAGKWGMHVQGATADADEPLEARILNQLALGAKTKSALADRLKRSRKDVDDAITVLFDARRIVTADVRVRGQVRKGFALRPADRRRPPPGAPDSIPDEPTDGAPDERTDDVR
jgi:hypothetical protein